MSAPYKQSLLAFLILISLSAFSQSKPEYFITLGGNLRVGGASDQKMFPIYGTNDALPDGAKLIGGFTVGFNSFIPLAEKFKLKGGITISRQVFWNDVITYTNGPNPQNQLGNTISRTIEYYGGASGVVHYYPWEKKRLSFGAGLGFQSLSLSWSTIPYNPSSYPSRLRNTNYKALMPVVPIEVSFTMNRLMYNVRYEQGLLNRYNGDLRKGGKNMYGLITFEVGLRLGRVPE